MLYGNFRTRTFNDIWEDVDSFLDDYKDNGVNTTVNEDNAKLLYYLMYARYGNSHISSTDETQFKYKIFSTIFMYGPAWESRLKIQDKLRNLLDNPDELLTGATQIFNDAYNPPTAPTTQTTEELQYINAQKVAKSKYGALGAYGQLYELIKTDVTELFLDKFKKFFIQIVEPYNPLWYITDDDSESETSTSRGLYSLGQED